MSERERIGREFGCYVRSYAEAEAKRSALDAEIRCLYEDADDWDEMAWEEEVERLINQQDRLTRWAGPYQQSPIIQDAPLLATEIRQ